VRAEYRKRAIACFSTLLRIIDRNMAIALGVGKAIAQTIIQA